MRTIEIVRGSAWPALQARAGLTTLDEPTWQRHAPDLHLAIADDDGLVVARCSCWREDVPRVAARQSLLVKLLIPPAPLSPGTSGERGEGARPRETSPGRRPATEGDAGSRASGGTTPDTGQRLSALGSDGATPGPVMKAGEESHEGHGAVPEIGERVGVIGHYAAVDAGAGIRVLREACARLAARGCARAVGPMDGNTWRGYRLVIERAPADVPGGVAEPPFFLEPDTPDEWVSHFTGAGFSVLATYTSALARDLTRRDERLSALEARLRRAGVTIRALDLTRADEELRRIHALSLVSFQDNFLYTPLNEAEFLEQNRRLLPIVRPELVLLAERGDELIGFLFAVPDVLRARQAPAAPVSPERPTPGKLDASDTIVIKTVAVRPGMTQAGLGSLLVAEVQQRAAGLGYTRAIHALMHEQNVSRNISRRYAETIRRYALFGIPLP